MALDQYTNTYTDVDNNVFDADDLVDEFERIADFINAWSESVGTGGIINTYEANVSIENNLIEGNPANGILQKFIVNDDVETMAVDFVAVGDGDPFRLYISLRFQNKDTVFTVSGPSGETHVFGVNRYEYSPSQVSADGFYTAMVIATYGKTNGLMIQVFADNSEADAVSANDALTVVAI